MKSLLLGMLLMIVTNIKAQDYFGYSIEHIAEMFKGKPVVVDFANGFVNYTDTVQSIKNSYSFDDNGICNIYCFTGINYLKLPDLLWQLNRDTSFTQVNAIEWIEKDGDKTFGWDLKCEEHFFMLCKRKFVH